MANITSSLTGYLFGLLTSETGIAHQARLESDTEISTPSLESLFVTIQNSAPEFAERNQNVRYPAIYIYCDKLTNSLKEKFSTFSGKGRLVIEVRSSADCIQGVVTTLDTYTDAACQILDASRGGWQDGAFYTGGYEVSYSPIRHGGKNFLQIAKIAFDVEVSK